MPDTEPESPDVRVRNGESGAARDGTVRNWSGGTLTLADRGSAAANASARGVTEAATAVKARARRESGLGSCTRRCTRRDKRSAGACCQVCAQANTYYHHVPQSRRAPGLGSYIRCVTRDGRARERSTQACFEVSATQSCRENGTTSPALIRNT